MRNLRACPALNLCEPVTECKIPEPFFSAASVKELFHDFTIALVLLSCHMLILWKGSPVSLSHVIKELRNVAMPIHAMSLASSPPTVKLII